MLGVSGLAPQLERVVDPNGNSYVVYRDPAYGISQNIVSPFKGANLTQQQRDFNCEMSKVCI